MTGRQAQDRLLRVLRETVLTVGAVAGSLCLLFALLGPTAGVRTLVFTSGSMSPTIETGDLAITRPVEVAGLAVGDVVSVVDDRGIRITHRVVELDAGRHMLVLKGDANVVPDAQPYRVDRVDRVLFSLPAAGYLLTWLSSSTAMVLIGVYMAFLLWVLLPHGRAQQPSPSRRGSRRRAGTTLGIALAIGLVAGGTPQPEPTLAAWTDAAPVTGTSFTAYTVTKPAITACSASVLTVTVTWTAVSSPYALTYTATVVETGQVLTVTGTGATRSAAYTTTLQTVVGATHTIRIVAALPSTPAWTSVPSNQIVRLGLIGLAPSCGASS